MINKEQLEEIFKIINELHSLNQKNDHSNEVYKKTQDFLFGMIIFSAAYLILTMIIVIIMVRINININNDYIISAFLSEIVLCFCSVLIMSGLRLYSVWPNAKYFNSKVCEKIKNNAFNNIDSTSKLLSFEKVTLEYALTQYKSGLDDTNIRVISIVGNIKTFGLFPGLASLSIAAASLIDKNVNPYFLIMIVSTGILYLVALFVSEKIKISQGIIPILKYVISTLEDKEV